MMINLTEITVIGGRKLQKVNATKALLAVSWRYESTKLYHPIKGQGAFTQDTKWDMKTKGFGDFWYGLAARVGDSTRGRIFCPML